jgi:hypothetical protein
MAKRPAASVKRHDGARENSREKAERDESADERNWLVTRRNGQYPAWMLPKSPVRPSLVQRLAGALFTTSSSEG